MPDTADDLDRGDLLWLLLQEIGFDSGILDLLVIEVAPAQSKCPVSANPASSGLDD